MGWLLAWLVGWLLDQLLGWLQFVSHMGYITYQWEPEICCMKLNTYYTQGCAVLHNFIFLSFN